MKKKGNALEVIIIAVVILSIGVILLLINKRIPDFIEKFITKSFQQESQEKPQEEFTEKPPQINAIANKPWSHSNTKLETTPSLPSIQEADDIYKGIVTAVTKRDYQSFKNLANSERIWSGSNNKQLIGESEDGIRIFKVVPINPEENFTKNAPVGILSHKPNPDIITPTKIEWYDPPSRELEKFLLTTEDGKIGELIEPTIWRYTAMLFYTINDPQKIITGDGKIYLTYENNEWKFFADEWVRDIKKNATLGDQELPNSKIHTIVKLNDTYKPSEIEINQGEYIRWENISGVIQTTETNAEHWHSTFLNDHNYQKLFTIRGNYKYTIRTATDTFNGVILVK